MKARLFIAGVTAVAFAAGAQPARAQQSCESLTGLKLPYATITSATMVPEGPLPSGGGGRGGAAAPPLMVPTHCEVKGLIRPTADSAIGFAVWLPRAAAWNS